MTRQNAAGIGLENSILQSLAGMAIGSGTKILSSTAADGSLAGTIDYSHGGSAAAGWLRFDKWQIAWNQIFRLPYSGLTFVSNTWTYPTAFKTGTAPSVIVTPAHGFANCTPNSRDMSIAYVSNASDSSVIVGLTRSGASSNNFQAGDFIDVNLFAFGEAP